MIPSFAPKRKTPSDSKGSFVLLALVLVFILYQSIRLFFKVFSNTFNIFNIFLNVFSNMFKVDKSHIFFCKGFEILFIDKHLSEEAFTFCDR